MDELQIAIATAFRCRFLSHIDVNAVFMSLCICSRSVLDSRELWNKLLIIIKRVYHITMTLAPTLAHIYQTASLSPSINELLPPLCFSMQPVAQSPITPIRVFFCLRNNVYFLRQHLSASLWNYSVHGLRAAWYAIITRHLAIATESINSAVYSARDVITVQHH